MHLLYCAIRIISMMTDIYVWYYAKGLNIQEEDDEKEEKKLPENYADNIAMSNLPIITSDNWPESDK